MKKPKRMGRPPIPKPARSWREWVANRLIEERETAGLTQQQLADVLQVSRARVVEWERGDRPMPIDLLPALCHALGVTGARFLGEIGGSPMPQLVTDG